MSKYQSRYFIAKGQDATEIAQKGLDQVKQRDVMRSEFLKELGAVGFYEAPTFAPTAIVFETDDSRRGFIKSASQYSNGKTLHAYKPDLRTKIGKAADKQMKALATFDFSDYACRAYKVNHMTITSDGDGMALAISVAGYFQDHMVFKIPFGGTQGGQDTVDVEIPSDFCEISESQFIAFTREGKPLDQLVA